MLQIDNNTYCATITLDNTNAILTSLKSLFLPICYFQKFFSRILNSPRRIYKQLLTLPVVVVVVVTYITVAVVVVSHKLRKSEVCVG